MKKLRSLVLVMSVLLTGHLASAQDLSRYRAYALDSSLATVVTAASGRAAEAKTLHTRPATIQQFQWRAPYVGSTEALADPVHEIVFTFYNDALYQIVVTYDRGRTEGLTNTDILGALSATYGAPVPVSSRPRVAPAEVFPDSVVLGRWESPETLVTLVRGSYTPDFQLILVSKRLSTLARTAIREAVRLDAAEAPRRESELRRKEAGDASIARDKTRTTNKEAFRP